MIDPVSTKLSGSMVDKFRRIVARMDNQFSHITIDAVDEIDFAFELGKFVSISNSIANIPLEKMKESILTRLDLYVGTALVSSL